MLTVQKAIARMSRALIRLLRDIQPFPRAPTLLPNEQPARWLHRAETPPPGNRPSVIHVEFSQIDVAN
jgi:hypothetical protein